MVGGIAAWGAMPAPRRGSAAVVRCAALEMCSLMEGVFVSGMAFLYLRLACSSA